MKSFMSRAALAGLLMGVSVLASAATPAPKGAEVSIVSPADGATVPKTFVVKFAVENIALAPAGDVTKNTGHHHLLVDVAAVDANAPLPANDQFRHFGLGQTETSVELKPGTHTLQLLVADQNHIPHHPVVMSERITITVK